MKSLLTISDASLASLLKDCGRMSLRMFVTFSKILKQPKDLHEAEVSNLIKAKKVRSSQHSSRGKEPIPWNRCSMASRAESELQTLILVRGSLTQSYPKFRNLEMYFKDLYSSI